MCTENTETNGVTLKMSQTEMSSEGKIIKNLLIEIPNDFISDADTVFVGVDVEGHTVTQKSLMENILANKLMCLTDVTYPIFEYEKND